MRSWTISGRGAATVEAGRAGGCVFAGRPAAPATAKRRPASASFISSGYEQTLHREQAVARRRGETVGATVEDLDLSQLPDRSHSLCHGAGVDRVRAGRRRAGAAAG